MNQMDGAMKIAIVNRHPVDFVGGSELQCHNIARELTNRGHDVSYIAVSGMSDRVYDANYAVIPVDGNARSIVSAVLQVYPDVVYWRLNKFYLFRSAREMKKRKIPVIFAISHINDTRRFHHYFNKKDIMTRLRAVKHLVNNAINYEGYRYVDAVTSLNKDYLWKVPVAEQKLVMNSVDMQKVPFSWPRPFIIWVATIKGAKRPERFVELSKACADLGVDFLMVGPLTSPNYRWITEPGLSKNFYYIGPKSLHEVNGMIQESLFLVHTCLPEGFGNNFIQAWLCAKPTLSLGYDPAGTIMRERLGSDSRDDWDNFVVQTRAYISDAGLVQETGTRAKAYADATFSIPRTVDEVLDLMKTVISSK